MSKVRKGKGAPKSVALNSNDIVIEEIEVVAAVDQGLKGIDGFEERQHIYRDAMKGFYFNKHAFVLSALEGQVNTEVLESNYNRCAKLDGDCDFCMVSLIRLLYLARDHDNPSVALADAVERSLAAFEAFGESFWPHNGCPYPKSIVFWSENHILMLLSSSYLYRQYLRKFMCDLDSASSSAAASASSSASASASSSAAASASSSASASASSSASAAAASSAKGELEAKLLRAYLLTRQQYGMFEVLSHVYLPHSLHALFNLFDFADDEQIRSLAKLVIDRIANQLLYCTTDTGVCNLSASCRAFSRTRLRTHDHNVNQLIWMLIGISPDPIGPNSISDFLATTKWRPTDVTFQTALRRDRLQMNPPLDQLDDIFSEFVDLRDEVLPFYWSAGLVTHPKYARKTKEYLTRKRMQGNVHMWPVAFLNDLAESLFGRYRELSCGQVYVDVKLNMYKQPGGLCLSSFDHFNLGVCSFQQLPWIANIDGVGVWTQSGNGGESVAGFGMSNTHNPAVSQAGGLLVAAYSAPQNLRSALGLGGMFSFHVRLFWPDAAFDDSLQETSAGVTDRGLKSDTKKLSLSRVARTLVGIDFKSNAVPANSWWFGKRRNCYIGVMCTSETKKETHAYNDATYEVKKGEPNIFVRRICTCAESTWIVKVATTAEFDEFSDFQEHCRLNIKVKTDKSEHPKVKTVTALERSPFCRIPNSCSSSSSSAVSSDEEQDNIVVAHVPIP